MANKNGGNFSKLNSEANGKSSSRKEALMREIKLLKTRERSSKCWPFLVAENDSVGRYMVASRDIKPLEVYIYSARNP